MPPKLLLTAGLTMLVLGCSVFQPGQANVSATRPDDFRVQYEWREGSMPPPYHYEYTIVIEPDGAGRIEMVPDYPGEGVPVWVEQFTLDAAALDGLYALMREKRVFSRQWLEEDDPPVGGSYSWADVTANGQSVRLSPFVQADQARDAQEVFSAIQQLVPLETWDKLETQRQQYVDEFSE